MAGPTNHPELSAARSGEIIEIGMLSEASDDGDGISNVTARDVPSLGAISRIGLVKLGSKVGSSEAPFVLPAPEPLPVLLLGTGAAPRRPAVEGASAADRRGVDWPTAAGAAKAAKEANGAAMMEAGAGTSLDAGTSSEAADEGDSREDDGVGKRKRRLGDGASEGAD